MTSKIHAVVGALGNPVDFIITGGQVHDVTRAKDLLLGKPAEFVLADKGYYSDDLIESLC